MAYNSSPDRAGKYRACPLYFSKVKTQIWHQERIQKGKQDLPRDQRFGSIPEEVSQIQDWTMDERNGRELTCQLVSL